MRQTSYGQERHIHGRNALFNQLSQKHTYTHATIYFLHVVTETNTDKKPQHIQRTETHIHTQVPAQIVMLKLFIYQIIKLFGSLLYQGQLRFQRDNKKAVALEVQSINTLVYPDNAVT